MRSLFFFRTLLPLCLLYLSEVGPLLHADPKKPEAAAPDPLDARLRAQLLQLDRELQEKPNRIPLLSQRGDCHLFLGQFREAVADFESMIALDPRLDAGHWRLGIAYHFNRQFEASSKQFAKYHAYDGRDRENGLWKFLGDAQLVGIPRARAQMLEYTAFDREPFPLLYALFAGQTTPEALWADLKKRSLLQQPMVAFFAHYYCGLWDAVDGRPESARDNLARAVQLFSAQARENSGPGYMGQVARLHLQDALAGFPTLRPAPISQP